MLEENLVERWSKKGLFFLLLTIQLLVIFHLVLLPEVHNEHATVDLVRNQKATQVQIKTRAEILSVF